ncbi:MFS transporter [Metabacillus arenae]|uniref:MFS transporter n=1 Tax=Metabacillus arenae TaxID=2771434 RepID=A0A926RYD8_9BACI|nr:MFS transporter [Metabacillus arenae]MBD1381961.1 MFS transporter [Metabacillus arenae]
MINKYKGSYVSYVLMFTFYFFALGIFSSIMSIYLSGIGKSASEISFIVSSVGIFSVLTQPFVGYLIDKTQKPKLVSAITLLLAGVTGVVFIFFHNNVLLFILNGFTLAFINSVSPINEKLATNSRFRYGIIRMWGAIGFAIASQIAGLVYDHISPSFNFVLFFVAIIISIIGYYGTTQIEVDINNSSQSLSFKEVNSALLKNKRYFLFLLLTFIFTGMTGVNNTFLPLLITEKGGSVSIVGTIIFFATLVEIPIILLSHLFLDRVSGRVLLIISFVVILLQFSAYSLISSLNIIIVSTVLFKALATMLFIMITLKIVINIVESSYINSALAIAATGKALGGLVFQLVGGKIVVMYDIETLYFFFTFISLLGIIISFMMKIEGNSKNLFNGQNSD